MRLRAIPAVAAVLIAAALALSFELGRHQAGFSLLDERRERAALEAELAARAARIGALERELAILRTGSQIDSEASAAIRANLADLEARLQAQEEELAFYRVIVAPDDGVAGLRIQSVQIEPGQIGAEIGLRVLLVQTIADNAPVSGNLRASLHGNQGGQAKSYTLSELGPGVESGSIDFEFRYFQPIETMLSLPAGFVPTELVLEVWPLSPQGETIVQTYSWSSLEG